MSRLLSVLVLIPLWLQVPTGPSPAEQAEMDAQNATLRATLAAAPQLPFTRGPIAVQAPATAGWALGMVSWVSADRSD